MLALAAVQMILLYYPRCMVFRSAFAGMSKNRKKKILSGRPLLQRLTLFYALQYNKSAGTKIRIICYYSMILLCAATDVLCIIRQYQPGIHNAVYCVGGVTLILGVALMIADVLERRMERNRRK